MSEKPKALGAELVVPALAFAFTVYFLYSTSGLQWEARSNGLIIGTLLLVLVAVQVVRVGIDFTRKRGTFGFGTLVTPVDIFRKRLGLIAIAIAFVATLPWLGLAIGLFLALGASFALMGVRPMGRVLLVTFAITLVCWLGFTVALDMGLPPGPVEKLVAHFTP